MLAGKKTLEGDGVVPDRAEDASSSAQILASAGESSWSIGLSLSWCPFTNRKEKDIERMSSKASISINTSRSIVLVLVLEDGTSST